MELTKEELQIIENGKKTSPYFLTKDEYFLLKRKIKELNSANYYLTVHIRKFRGDISIDIHSGLKGLDIKKTVTQSLFAGHLRTAYKTDVEKEHQTIVEIISQFETVFSERDSMSDYAGNYRIGAVLVYCLSSEAFQAIEEVVRVARRMPSFIASEGTSFDVKELDYIIQDLISDEDYHSERIVVD